jgi:hypothetical protein
VIIQPFFNDGVVILPAKIGHDILGEFPYFGKKKSRKGL